MPLTVEFERRPWAPAYMVRAFHRCSPFELAAGFPALRCAWRGVRARRAEVAALSALTGLPDDGPVPLLFPHVTGFRLLMSLLTHPAWPLPIWRALQVRNHLVLHRPLEVERAFDLDARVGDYRSVERGLEVDLCTQARVGGEVAWESLVTFYYRGRHGEPSLPSPLARAPDPPARELARWRTAASGGRARMGRLTGDYNGIHLWSPYARLFGFQQAFHHPQRVLGQCMAHLAGPEAHRPQRLDAWLKGPVCYGADVVLRGGSQDEAITFGLFADADTRPAIVGRWAPLAADARAPW